MKDQPPESAVVTIVPKSPKEALFLQFAQAYDQEMQAVGKNAPFGQVWMPSLSKTLVNSDANRL